MWGGASVAWYLAQLATPPLAGVIAAGGRPADEIPTETIRFAHFGTAGESDFNYLEMQELDALVASRGAPHQFRSFAGRHAWMPSELAAEAVEWMELVAMRTGLRAVDQERVEASFARSVEQARALATSGAGLVAQRRYETIAATFDGLRNVSEIRAAIADLEADPSVASQREAERRAEVFEARARARLMPPLGRLEGGVRYGSWQDVANEMQLDDLKRAAAAAAAPQGAAASRVLAWAFGRAGFYIQRDHVERERFEAAAASLRVAVEIRPGAMQAWNQLVIALARCGRDKEACGALQSAIAAGFFDLEGLERNALVAKLLERPDCAATVATLRANPIPSDSGATR